MRHSYRPVIPSKPQPYRTQILDHLGLVAGMFDELGITEQNLENLRRNRYAPISIAPRISCGMEIMRRKGAKRCVPSKATFAMTR